MQTGFDSAIHDAKERGECDLARRIDAEKRICDALVTACLDRGFTISISDGEDWPVRRSTDKAAILAALFTTDEDLIVIHDQHRDQAGWFSLVYGNDGHDVVHDCSANDVCNEIWNKVIRPLSDKIEQED